MKDYFKFPEELKADDEVLTTNTGDRIYSVIGVNSNKIVISNGAIYDKENGDIFTKKKDVFGSLLELTTENKSRIEADAERARSKEEKEQQERLIRNEYDELVGNSYKSKHPSIENQQKIIDFIKTLR